MVTGGWPFFFGQIRQLFELIYQDGTKSVSELSEKVFWSSRQINRYFNQQFGFSLKEFIKIVRCNAAYKDISNGKLSPQTDYFDQAHFIKEVKKEGFRSITVRLPTPFVRSTTLCLPIKTLLFFISFSPIQINMIKEKQNVNFHHFFEVLLLNWIKTCMDQILILLK